MGDMRLASSVQPPLSAGQCRSRRRGRGPPTAASAAVVLHGGSRRQDSPVKRGEGLSTLFHERADGPHLRPNGCGGVAVVVAQPPRRGRRRRGRRAAAARKVAAGACAPPTAASRVACCTRRAAAAEQSRERDLEVQDLKEVARGAKRCEESAGDPRPEQRRSGRGRQRGPQHGVAHEAEHQEPLGGQAERGEAVRGAQGQGEEELWGLHHRCASRRRRRCRRTFVVG
mmetsp:Transcript_63288/g.127095  ORF Transcript_63288/g.127095 Transcript_63288/m.127095 type:complete len:228 (-) Transcript_63288:931-1614(-)